MDSTNMQNFKTKPDPKTDNKAKVIGIDTSKIGQYKVNEPTMQKETTFEITSFKNRKQRD